MIRQAGKIKADLDFMEKEDMSEDSVEGVLKSLKDSCIRLGKTMEGALFRREDISA